MRVRAAGAITMVSFWLAFCAGLPASVTLTNTVELPDAVGVPLTVHPLRFSPAGSAPVIEQVYGVVPPLAVMFALYTTPTCPFGSVLVIASAAGEITIVSSCLAFCAGLPASVTLTVTVALPATVGVPLTVQPVRPRPAGSAPVIEQVYGVVPPLAVMFALYATPTWPFGSVFVRLNCEGAITIVSFALTFCAGALESVTFTVTVELPAVVGVPLTVQPLMLKPAGSVPAVIEHM